LSRVTCTLVKLEDNLESENLEINLEHIMGEHRYQRIMVLWWMSQGALNLVGPLHEMPRKSDNILPKFDPEISGSPGDHLNNFFLATHMLNVQHEDTVCRLFPYTFSSRASTWYFSLSPNSITSWDNFERVFIRKFRERKIIASLYKELGAIKMDKRKKVKYFNQIFLNVLTKFTNDTAPSQSLAIEYYMASLIPSMGMFFKGDNKKTLALNFDEDRNGGNRIILL
jgi:hypothetical protein